MVVKKLLMGRTKKSQKTHEGQGASSSAPVRVIRRFLNDDAIAAYSKCLGTKSLLAERGFDYESFGLGADFRRREWEQLCEVPNAVVVPIVREFYANAHVGVTGGWSWVRGQTIEYDPTSLNQFFGLPNFDGDNYRENINRPVTVEEVLEVLAEPGATWSYSQGKPLHLKEKLLLDQAKGVYKFVCANLMPTGHHNTLNWPRAVLVYTIMTGGSVDIGNLIHSQMKVIASRSSTLGFCFPSLITSLCLRAQCEWDEDLERLPVKPAISHTSLIGNARDFSDRQARVVVEDADVSTYSVDERIDELSTWMAEIEMKQDSIIEMIQQFQSWSASVMQAMAAAQGLDTLPPWPPVPPSDF